MTYTDHTTDVSLDLSKNRGITVCSAINNPGNIQKWVQYFPVTSDLKSRVENLHGVDFYVIPMC